jgi:hypothetical protein
MIQREDTPGLAVLAELLAEDEARLQKITKKITKDNPDLPPVAKFGRPVGGEAQQRMGKSR